MSLPKNNDVHGSFTGELPPVCNDEAAWREQRRVVLQLEKNLTRQYDAMVKARRSMPWFALPKDYTWQDEAGNSVLLSSLVNGSSKPLLVQHVMFANDWDEPCSNCSMWIDGYQGLLPQLSLLANVVAVCDATPEKIRACKQLKGWTCPFYSVHGTTFNQDLRMSQTQEQVDGKAPMGYNFDVDSAPNPFGCTELPGTSIFAERDGRVCLVNSIAGRGLEPLCAIWSLADLLPQGRDGRNLFPHKESIANEKY